MWTLALCEFSAVIEFICRPARLNLFAEFVMLVMSSVLGVSCSIQPRPTKRAPDGWWAPRFELDSNEELGSVSLVGSPSRR